MDISSYFGIEDFDIEAMFIDITIFPIYDKNGNIPYAAAMLAKKHVYRGKKEIERAKEYIESHSTEAFNINEAAKAAYLSKTHLTRLFKKHTGLTPHEYYMESKIKKLQETLLKS